MNSNDIDEPYIGGADRGIRGGIVRGGEHGRRFTPTLDLMARSPLTLAALATSAVAGLDVTAASRHGSPEGRFDAAALVTRDGQRLLIKVPRTQTAETQASADLIALRALSAGVRGRLPFAAPTALGQAPVSGTRAVVYDLLPGANVALDQIVAGSSLAASIGRAISAIHELPTSFIADTGLSVVRPLDALAAAVTVMDQSVATGLVPAALVVRWENATEDPTLWQFAPTVIHGAIAGSSLLTDGDRVTGVLDWHSLSAGDPARDLVWVLGANSSAGADSVFDAYTEARGSTDRQVKKRAMLYAELEIAKWLLHGTKERSTEIVDDAVAMLHNLVDVVQHDSTRRIDSNTSPVMTVAEVEEMLDRKNHQ